MAYNNNYHQQAPFWDFVRSFDQGAGIDHTAQGFQGPRGVHPLQPNGPDFGHPLFSGGRFAAGPSHHGHANNYPAPGGFGFGPHRGGHRGRHGRRRDATPEGESPEARGSRSASPHGEHKEDEEGEGEGAPRESQGPGEDIPHRGRDRHAHGFGHYGRGGHRGGRGGWGPCGHRGSFPQFGARGPQGADWNALFDILPSHPIVEALRNFAGQSDFGASAQRSGETGQDADDTFTPPIDIFSTDKAYVLHVALPGAKKEDVGVNWDSEMSALNIAGVVYRLGDEEFLKTLSTAERKVGVFERTVKLPPGNEEKEEVDGDAITAKLEDGVLIVTVPKVEKEWTEIKKVDIE
ncbi:hypothetical protein B7494_g2447 [Chlorociboria aeruginascens]|nr:hypothetical protein B7494_g2447 [Chlorociboria aeruginascens]